MKKIVAVVCALSIVFGSFAQKNKPAKYPALLWEITGNGLKKPSYLFGTMHVSNKMVFHLSDSFYTAISKVDAVSLELNPQSWQPEMFRMEKAQADLRNYTLRGSYDDYITEKSFKIIDYEDKLKTALNEEPTQVNGLLYRTYQQEADFEENTYLDLYIYQTGRKLGKRAAGVEDYFETEKLVMEAYSDMAKEKTKKKVDTDGESYYDLQKKLQDAYRKGDLDMIDSLNKLTVTSDAFNEKFLYVRNVIQANSIDSIMKKESLFVGVGAAHLPGDRGVIELLRSKGYKLRPVKMANRDAEQKDRIDKLRVPVVMKQVSTNDGFVAMKMPGNLFDRSETRLNQSWQYSDMENGAYYMVTRVKTHAAMLGQTEADVIKKTDSLLYENIPGKIIKRSVIVKNGYKGYDITNKTRRGDIQRYNIIVTPYETIVFKMSGNDEYVYGKEADDFFGSIQIKEAVAAWANYEPLSGGFKASFPQQPNVTLNTEAPDNIATWEYESTDKNTGDAYMIWKKSIHNYRFLEEDTFDLSLMEESLLRSEIVDKQDLHQLTKVDGYPALDMLFKLKNGDILKARAIIKGPHYYLIAARSKKQDNKFAAFFDNFKLTDFKYTKPVLYADTTFNFNVATAVVPKIDNEIRDMVEKVASDMVDAQNDKYYSYWPKDRYAAFKNDTTGELVMVSVQTFPKYFYSTDTLKFWDDQLRWDALKEEYTVEQKQFFSHDSISGYKYALTDTNSSRKMLCMAVLKNNQLFRITTLTDNIKEESSFIKQFYGSFAPDKKTLGQSIFINKLDSFFADYYSSDSVVKKRAQSSLSNVRYGPEGLDKIKTAIANLKLGDKDYFNIKTRFIAELGYIDDSCCTKKVIDYLKELYVKTADTSAFQNPVLMSFAKIKTKQSYALLKDLLVQEPPVFEGDYGYQDLFDQLKDSLPLAKTLFPEVLQLSTLQDYKEPVTSLLRELVDSNYLVGKDYENYYSKFYFDAKILLKKLQNRDVKELEKDSDEKPDEEKEDYEYYDTNNNDNNELDDCSLLLMPFYDKYPAVPAFFNRLLQSRDSKLKLSTALLMLRNNKPVADTIMTSLAADDLYRSQLLRGLEKIKKTALLPEQYKKQEVIARSLLLNDKNYQKYFAIECVGKQYVETKKEKGYVYFFKYKIKKDGDWKIGLSGVQPINENEVSSNDDLTKMIDKKYKFDETADEQFKKQLKQLLFSQRQSAREFYEDKDYRSLLRNYQD